MLHGLPHSDQYDLHDEDEYLISASTPSHASSHALRRVLLFRISPSSRFWLY